MLYPGFPFTMPLTRSQIMKRIRSKGSLAEVSLRKALWQLGIRYRKNAVGIFGRPDISISKLKIAVFCDGDFWHGKKLLAGEVPKNNRKFWVEKLQGNIERDRVVNKELRGRGWTVLRFWENEILKNPKAIAKKIAGFVKKRKE